MRLGELLNRFAGMRALVVGDLMLDEYIFGQATRISPEAPVMVVRQTSTSQLPGGAANVARNLLALGARATMVGVVGCDRAGELLEESLASLGIDPSGLIHDKNRTTTRKTRVLADHAHQVLRIDVEQDDPVSEPTAEAMFRQVTDRIGQLDVILMSDYLKGALRPEFIRRTCELARTQNVPVIVNPKPRSLPNYAGATLVSLNRLEASETLGLWNGLDDAGAEEAARQIKESAGVQSVLLTLGESGMVAVGDRPIKVPAPKVEVYDTAGAGDTVIATVALGLASIGFEPAVFELAAQTAASVVRKVGVATPSKDDLAAIRAL